MKYFVHKLLITKTSFLRSRFTFSERITEDANFDFRNLLVSLT